MSTQTYGGGGDGGGCGGDGFLFCSGFDSEVL
jgi:hypothetical protein